MEKGTPIQVKHVATVSLGPEFRRGALDKAAVEAVGGMALMRYGENPLRVVERVKAKIKQLEPGLPQKKLADGRIPKVKIVAFYDRTDIVKQTIDTLKEALLEEALMASAVILIFLLHCRSTISVIVTLPLSVGICFILMYVFGVDSNWAKQEWSKIRPRSVPSRVNRPDTDVIAIRESVEILVAETILHRKHREL